MRESTILQLVRLALSRAGVTAFRNNVGRAWMGQATRITHTLTITLYPGDVVIRDGRPVEFGLCKGSSDAVGWLPYIVQERDVGRPVAVFTVAETKSPRGVASAEQRNFLDAVKHAGGVAILARGPEDIAKGIDAWINRT